MRRSEWTEIDWWNAFRAIYGALLFSGFLVIHLESDRSLIESVLRSVGWTAGTMFVTIKALRSAL